MSISFNDTSINKLIFAAPDVGTSAVPYVRVNGTRYFYVDTSSCNSVQAFNAAVSDWGTIYEGENTSHTINIDPRYPVKFTISIPSNGTFTGVWPATNALPSGTAYFYTQGNHRVGTLSKISSTNDRIVNATTSYAYICAQPFLPRVSWNPTLHIMRYAWYSNPSSVKDYFFQYAKPNVPCTIGKYGDWVLSTEADRFRAQVDYPMPAGLHHVQNGPGFLLSPITIYRSKSGNEASQDAAYTDSELTDTFSFGTGASFFEIHYQVVDSKLSVTEIKQEKVCSYPGAAVYAVHFCGQFLTVYNPPPYSSKLKETIQKIYIRLLTFAAYIQKAKRRRV